jgi:hypothetical protein
MEKTRYFNGKKFRLVGEYDTRWHAEAGKERVIAKKSPFVQFRLIKIVSKAPPQGDVFYRLYYRHMNDDEIGVRIRRNSKTRRRRMLP